jgi:basic amino acid/polyamine antiporter, APA family
MKTTEPPAEKLDAAPAPRLGLWDAVSIIIGIVVGTAIFRSPAAVFANSPTALTALTLWLVGGLLSWCGAVCYAELATTYPRDGGDYVYLTRAFGPWCGFLFCWAQLTTVLSGNIAIMAYAFADYSLEVWPDLSRHDILFAIAPVIALSIVNAAGIVAGKFAQNLLTAAKVLGLAGLVLAGLFAAGSEARAAAPPNGSSAANIGLALVFVLYAYGGWNHAPYVAAEVRDERRSLPRALIFGLVGIAAIYLAVNATYVAVLGFDAARQSQTPAADVMEQAVGAWGGRAISLLVMLSALSAINGMILTGSRVYATWGADFPALSWLAEWNRRSAAPLMAIAVQAAIAVGLIAVVGTEAGRGTFDAALTRLGLAPLPWEQYFGGFETLIAASTPVFWVFTFLTIVAVFVLRSRDRNIERPFRIPIYPLPPIIFAATCMYMLWASISYARWLTLLGFVPLIVGALFWFLIGWKKTP